MVDLAKMEAQSEAKYRSFMDWDGTGPHPSTAPIGTATWRRHIAYSHEWQYGTPPDDDCYQHYTNQTTLCQHHRKGLGKAGWLHR